MGASHAWIQPVRRGRQRRTALEDLRRGGAAPMREIGTPLADRMGKPARDNTHPNLRPRDASTLILIDRSKPAPQVLLGRRHHSHKFMPGMFVFPGGRVETDDRRMPAATPPEPGGEARLR